MDRQYLYIILKCNAFKLGKKFGANESFIYKEIKSELRSGNNLHHSVQKSLPSWVLSIIIYCTLKYLIIYCCLLFCVGFLSITAWH